MPTPIAFRPTHAPHKTSGWARGLIHFHTRFSDGWATVFQAAEIAKRHGYDFLIVTDHIQDLKLKTGRTLDEYLRACARASRIVDFPVIPGGEFEVDWTASNEDDRPADGSEAHTLAFDITPLVGALDWTPKTRKPYDHWEDENGCTRTLAAVLRTLRGLHLPVAASHQFQHSFLSTRPGEHSDYRYDLRLIGRCTHADFFYSGSVDVLHEAEDLELITQYKYALEYTRPVLFQTGLFPTDRAAAAALDPGTPQAVYASCDYHVGPEVIFPPLAALILSVPYLNRAYAWLFRIIVGTVLRFFGSPESAAFPDFAAEQLSHATYVYLGDQEVSRDNILANLAAGRTVVTRGTAEFSTLLPVPGTVGLGEGHPVEIHLQLPVTYSRQTPRPHHVLLYRVREERAPAGAPFPRREVSLVDMVTFPPNPSGSEIHFHYRERDPLDLQRFRYWYQLYIPTKFLSSPIVVDH